MTYRNVDDALSFLSNQLRTVGAVTESRNGATRDIANNVFTILVPRERYITLPGRKANMAAQVVETAWVLGGRQRIEYLTPYLPRAAQFSDDGETWRGAYGPRLRSWNGSVDQVAHVIRLLKADPDSRRAVISLFDPARDFADSKDIPCNDLLQFRRSSKGALGLTVYARSNDLIWGWSGINQFEWSVLLETVANCVGMPMGRITYLQGSLHAYEHHWDLLGTLAPLATPSPARWLTTATNISSLEELNEQLGRFWDGEFAIRNQIDGWRGCLEGADPMIAEWLRILAAYWTGDADYLASDYTRAAFAVSHRARPKPSVEDRAFVKFADELHRTKSAAYGNSWRKRGELFSILPNIARKADRLGSTDDVETAADTALDLAIYLAKYLNWLHNGEDGEEADIVRMALEETLLDRSYRGWASDVYEHRLREGVDVLLNSVEQGNREGLVEHVDELLSVAGPYARELWHP